MYGIINLFGPVLGSIVIVFLFALALLWFLLPFYIYQIRNRLDTLIEELKQTKSVLIVQNTMLDQLPKSKSE